MTEKTLRKVLKESWKEAKDYGDASICICGEYRLFRDYDELLKYMDYESSMTEEDINEEYLTDRYDDVFYLYDVGGDSLDTLENVEELVRYIEEQIDMAEREGRA